MGYYYTEWVVTQISNCIRHRSLAQDAKIFGRCWHHHCHDILSFQGCKLIPSLSALPRLPTMPSTSTPEGQRKIEMFCSLVYRNPANLLSHRRSGVEGIVDLVLFKNHLLIRLFRLLVSTGDVPRRVFLLYRERNLRYRALHCK